MNEILEISADAYHGDPLDTPSLSKSIIHILTTSSPAHAWAAHPKLNPEFGRTESATFDIGTVAHALLLEEKHLVEVVYEKDWKKKAAQEARDEARARGAIPLLADQWHRVQAMLAAARPQLDRVTVEPGLFVDGRPEQMVVWEEAGVQCRALVDWLHDDHSAIDDYKTTGKSASPEAWSRACFGQGADIQAAFYMRGVRAVTGRTPAFRFVVQETSPPYALSVFEPGPDVLAVADAKIDFALERWKRCLDSGSWPGYPSAVATIELPPWEEPRWLERLEREAA